MADVESKDQKEWFYSDVVKKHFMNPKNIALSQEQIDIIEPNGLGEVGSPACGDVMKMWIHVEQDKITKCVWKTFGCASAIASTSMLSLMITENGGMKLADAMNVTPKDIITRLQGLPTVKIHCSVLGDQALRAAIKDYQNLLQKDYALAKK